MTTPRSMTSEELEADLADKEAEIEERLREVCADPVVAEKMRGPVGLLTEVREIVARHNAAPGTEWSPDEAAALLLFLGDLVHDVELVRELLALRGFVGFPRVLREERLGE